MASQCAGSSTKFDIEDGRHFRNVNPDYESDSGEICNGKFSEAITAKLQSTLDNMVAYMNKNLYSLDPHDSSVYTGLAGVSYMFWYLAFRESDVAKRDDLLKSSIILSKRAKECPKDRHVTFLCGDPGPMVVSLLCGAPGAPRETQIQELLKYKSRALNQRIPDELLYGRAGYLYALLITRRLGVMVDQIDAAIKETTNVIFLSGLHGSSLLPESDNNPPMMFKWHDSYYLGAAHGLTGILYIIMNVPPELMEYDAIGKYIKPTIDWLMTLQFASGNYPSSWHRERDKLVHWCHGAPGWIYMFLRAYELLKDPKYLEQARICGEVIWARGLLQKGYGICHGIAGNGYAFCALYRATGEERYLHRALKFAEFCCEYGQHGCGTPDRPLSLFEGLAGTICYLRDVMNPKEARFPCFEL